jgi:hypothetical protein
MYRLSFEDNALIEENPAMMTGDDLLDSDMEEEEPAWYEVYWWIAPLLGLFGAVAFILMRFLKRPSEAADEEEGDDEGDDDMAEAGGFPEADDDDEMEDFPEPEEIPEPEEVEAVKPE